MDRIAEHGVRTASPLPTSVPSDVFTALWVPFGAEFSFLCGDTVTASFRTQETVAVELMLFRKDFKIQIRSFIFIMFPAETGVLTDVLNELMIKPIQVQKPKKKQSSRGNRED